MSRRVICATRAPGTAYMGTSEMALGDTAPLAEVHGLNVRFVTREATVHAVNGVSFTVRPGEVLCILGESGSGKTVTLRALIVCCRRDARRSREPCGSMATMYWRCGHVRCATCAAGWWR